MPADQTPPAREPGRWMGADHKWWECVRCHAHNGHALEECPTRGCLSPRPPMPEAEPPTYCQHPGCGHARGNHRLKAGGDWCMMAGCKCEGFVPASPTGEGAPSAWTADHLLRECEAIVDREGLTFATVKAALQRGLEIGAGSRPTGEGAEREVYDATVSLARNLLHQLDPQVYADDDTTEYATVGNVRELAQRVLSAAALLPSRPVPRETPLLTEALDLVPRISDDDPMVPALADWCRRVRASLSAAPRETEPSEAPDEVFARIVDLGATERLAVLRAALKLNLLTHAEFDAAQYRELSRAALRASNGGAER